MKQSKGHVAHWTFCNMVLKVSCLKGHKCHDVDLKPHSAEQNTGELDSGYILSQHSVFIFKSNDVIAKNIAKKYTMKHSFVLTSSDTVAFNTRTRLPGSQYRFRSCKAIRSIPKPLYNKTKQKLF